MNILANAANKLQLYREYGCLVFGSTTLRNSDVNIPMYIAPLYIGSLFISYI